MYTYIQQAKVKPRSEWKDSTILGALDLKYMGSAEFDFGALPEALARFLASPKLKVWGKIRVAMPVSRSYGCEKLATVTVRYLAPHDKVEAVEYMLNNWVAVKSHFKERNVGLQSKGDFCFAIDRGAECFFWRGRQGEELLMECVKRSRDVLIANDWFEKAEASKLVELDANQLLTRRK